MKQLKKIIQDSSTQLKLIKNNKKGQPEAFWWNTVEQQQALVVWYHDHDIISLDMRNAPVNNHSWCYYSPTVNDVDGEVQVIFECLCYI